MRRNSIPHWLLVSAFLVLVAVCYLYGVGQQSTLKNPDLSRSDQGVFMEYARSLRESGYRFVGGRNRMPLYPLLQSLVYRPGMAEETFFVQGKWFSVLLSLGMLAVLYAIFWRYLPWHAATNLLLITAFTVFVFKAPFFQPEVLFYFLNFCAFLLTLEMLRRPTWWRAVLGGVLLGLSHLTKASVLPGLVLFLVWAAPQAVVTWGRQRRAEGRASLLAPLRRLWLVILVGLVFLAVVYPYISTSKRIYGRYFYNVNSTFYMWYDSWEEAKAGTRAHGDRDGWPDMPAEEIPSLGKYLREHSVGQMLDRVRWGGDRILHDALYSRSNSYGYALYLLLYGLAVVVSAAWVARETWSWLRRKPFQALYILSYFGVYALLYMWFMPIGRGNRFVLGQFLPLMFTFSLVLAGPHLRGLGVVVRGKRIAAVDLFHGLVTLVLIPHVCYILTQSVKVAYGGN